MEKKQLKPLEMKGFDEVDFKFDAETETIAHTGITFWIPIELKEKYERLQNKSRRKFGRKLKAAIIKSIAQVSEDVAS